MKLKYKKIILLTTMSTMGIGLLTLSISQDNPKAEESLSPQAKQESTLLASAETFNVNTLSDEDATTITSLAAEPTATPTPMPTPTPLPVYELEKEGYPEIEAFYKDYYAAKSNLDAEKIKSMSSDPSKAMTLENLQQEVLDLHIEDYRNIKCYVKKGYEEGSYIVYVYTEVKFSGIITPAPGLSRDYLVTDREGNLKTFTGEMDPVLQEYYDARMEDEDFLELIEYTEKKKEEAIKMDEALATYWDYLDSVSNKDIKTQAEGDSAE